MSIVVPVYKEQFDASEQKSLDRLIDVLGGYPIHFVCPKSLSLINYSHRFGRVMTQRFPDKYFKSLDGYNNLLTNSEFYRSFSEYEYILIYHPDAYVFRDEMEYWLRMGYDYIGAPLYRFDGTSEPADYIGVGNGGFSLRRVAAHLRVLKTFRRVYSRNEVYKWWSKYNFRGRLRYISYLFRMNLPFGGNCHEQFNKMRVNEDVFWGCLVGSVFNDFRVASFEDARQFSIEYNPRRLLELNANALPFGCHKWSSELLFPYWRNAIT